MNKLIKILKQIFHNFLNYVYENLYLKFLFIGGFL